MAKVFVKNFVLLSTRRAYSSVAVENVRVQTRAVASATRKAADSSSSVGKEDEAAEGQKDVFWMRDPKTGNWIPETHFNEVDVAELREKFLPNKAII